MDNKVIEKSFYYSAGLRLKQHFKERSVSQGHSLHLFSYRKADCCKYFIRCNHNCAISSMESDFLMEHKAVFLSYIKNEMKETVLH